MEGGGAVSVNETQTSVWKGFECERNTYVNVEGGRVVSVNETQTPVWKVEEL